MPTLGQTSYQYIPTMVFIDGGYLKKWAEDVCGIRREKFDYGRFTREIVDRSFGGIFKPKIIRTYFYDGLADPNEDFTAHGSQAKFQNWLNTQFTNFEVRTSYLRKLADKIETGKENPEFSENKHQKKFRQKGVDTLMAIDMVNKAASNQYELAVLIAGDLDHIEAIRAVKSRGKQVMGIYNKKNTHNELIASFDTRHELVKENGINCILNAEKWSPTWDGQKILPN